mgnify:FL=1
MMRFKKNINVFLVLFFLICENTYSIENKILIKVDNEIITSIDIINESKYLKALNPEINNLTNDKIFEISKNSILREKIKKIEILKRVNNVKVERKFLDKLIFNTYSKLGINSKDEFKKHLEKYKIDINTVEDKISIEAIWNEFIYFKFSNKVKIDEEKLRQEINQNNVSNNVSLFLYEIVFNEKDKDSLKIKYESIKKDISEKGFENAALIHSISDTSRMGGKVGWIKKNSLSKKIKDEIEKINIGEITEPITIPGGFLILNIKDKKKVIEEIDIEDELKNQISYNKNIQLNQFSNIYFNKIKKDVIISEN